METRERIQEARDYLLHEGIVVAIRLADGSQLVDVCRALTAGGLSVLEVTLTTPGALDAMHEMAKAPGLLVGGGTVLTRDDVRAVADAGGRFALSPTFDADVMDEAASLGLLAIPGASTSTEVRAASVHGASLVKVFPAGPLGGAEYIRIVRGPLPDVPLIPTSGPTADTLADYMNAGAVAVGVGGRELFPDGFSPATVEAGARRIRRAMDEWRAGKG